MYTFENLIDDVKKEAAALKVHATKEELGRLDANDFCPTHCAKDVYGQMCGQCDNDRALELIFKCCTTYVKFGLDDKMIDTKTFDNGRNWTPIEWYTTYSPEAENANLIAYLKSETETLDL